jgi:low affinity Fe/Cu permease
MDNRINEIRRKIRSLRAEMVGVEDAMHDQIRNDLDSTESALRLMTKRKELAALVAEWKAAGGSDPLPTIEERLKANNRPAQKPKTATRSR